MNYAFFPSEVVSAMFEIIFGTFFFRHFWTSQSYREEGGAEVPTSFKSPSSARVLLPTGSEDRGLLGAGSILVAILPSYEDVKIITLQLH